MKRAARLAYNIFIILLILNFCWKALELILKVTLETRCCISIKNKDIDGFKNSLADCQHYFYLGPNNIRFIHDRTLLHLACEYRFPEAVKFLLEEKANPNLQDDSGGTPLFELFHDSWSQKGFECFTLLVEGGASVNLNYNGGGTLLNKAIDIRDIGWVQCLVSAGASPNGNSKRDPYPPLIAACRGYREDGASTEIIVALLNAGADPELKDDLGVTATSVAKKGNNKVILELFNSRKR
jgi:ankyrin repeat protein